MTSHYIFRTILAAIALTFALMPIGCNSGLTSTANFDHLLLQLQSNRSLAKVGEPILIRFTITNTGRQKEIVESTDKPVMDIMVQIVGDGVILTWSEQYPDQVSHRLEWQPGESKVIELTWTPKQGEVYSGAFRDVGAGGFLNWGSAPGRSQSAGVRICASDACR